MHVTVRVHSKQLHNLSFPFFQKSEYTCPVPYHFYLHTWDVPFTIIYPFNKTDAELGKMHFFQNKDLVKIQRETLNLQQTVIFVCITL